VERMTPLRESIGGIEENIWKDEQTCAKVLSDKEDNGGDVEIARPLRDGRECDSCGALRLDASGKQRSLPRRERQKINRATASLVDVSVVLLRFSCVSVGRPSRARRGEDDGGDWNMREWGKQANSGALNQALK
jgi:hypothetical protein